MSVSYISWWAFRRPNGRAHLVESEVTDRLVMKCGRQMRMEVGGYTLIFQLEPSVERCEVCEGRYVKD